MNGSSCPWESYYIHHLLFSLVIDSREKTPTLIHIILFAVQMSNHEAIPYVKLPLRSVRVMPASGQQGQEQIYFHIIFMH